MAIYTRLKDLREDADKTQSDVARYLGTTAQYYGKYEKGERELPFDRAIRLAEYYNVTLDYLAGRSNNKLGQPLTDDEASIRREFASLQAFFAEIKKNYFPLDKNFSEISMGMSHDYRLALDYGTTMVRVGTLIFGERNY